MKTTEEQSQRLLLSVVEVIMVCMILGLILYPMYSRLNESPKTPPTLPAYTNVVPCERAMVAPKNCVGILIK